LRIHADVTEKIAPFVTCISYFTKLYKYKIIVYYSTPAVYKTTPG